MLGDGDPAIQNGNLTVTGGNLWFNGDVDIEDNGYAGSLEGYVTGEDGTQVVDGGNAYVAGVDRGHRHEVPGRQGSDRPAEDRRPAGRRRTSVRDAEHIARAKSNPCTDGPGIYGGVQEHAAATVCCSLASTSSPVTSSSPASAGLLQATG